MVALLARWWRWFGWGLGGLLFVSGVLVAQSVVSFLISAAFGWATAIMLGACLVGLVVAVPVVLFSVVSQRRRL